jgi:hypothetical protein
MPDHDFDGNGDHAIRMEMNCLERDRESRLSCSLSQAGKHPHSGPQPRRTCRYKQLLTALSLFCGALCLSLSTGLAARVGVNVQPVPDLACVVQVLDAGELR